MKYLFLILSISILSCGSSKEAINKQNNFGHFDFEVDFLKTNDLYAVLDRAESENKLVYIDIGTKWCLPCKMMKEDVYTDKGIGECMNDNFISYMVDAEKANGPNMTVIFDIKSFPTLLFLDTKGHVLQRKVGAAYHTELQNLGDLALAHQTNKI